MQSSTARRLALAFLLSGMIYFAAGCKKKVAAPPPAQAPAPAAAQPTVTLNASPSSIQSGGTVTLTWSSTNATDLDLQPGIGKVASRQDFNDGDRLNDLYDYRNRTWRFDNRDCKRFSCGGASARTTGCPTWDRGIVQPKHQGCLL